LGAAAGEFVTIVVVATLVLAIAGFVLLGPLAALAGASSAPSSSGQASSVARRRRSAIQLSSRTPSWSSQRYAGRPQLPPVAGLGGQGDRRACQGEFSRVLSEIRLGRDTGDALEALVVRVGSQDLEWAVTAIEIQRKIGGNLAEVLETVAKTIRERETLRRQVKVLSAEGRLSVVVLTVLPILIALYLMAVNPDYLRTLTTTTAGVVISSGAGVLMAIGYVWMKRIVTPRCLSRRTSQSL
jgi:tight adherence protein B